MLQNSKPKVKVTTSAFYVIKNTYPKAHSMYKVAFFSIKIRINLISLILTWRLN